MPRVALIFVAAMAWATAAHGQSAKPETARYRLIIEITWRAATHPFEFPAKAHLSPFVAASHTGRYVMFGDGRTASSGLELVAENGRPTILMQEIAEARRRRRVLDAVVGPDLTHVPGKVSLTVRVDRRRSRISFVSMVAPSPDWFTGVAGIEMRSNGRWIERLTLPLWAWDAGTDSGETFRATNRDTQPRESVRLLATLHFLGDFGLRAVGRVTFVRLP